MKYDSHRRHRRSIRLRGYDYSQSNAYFVTLCVKDRESLFGTVTDCKMELNQAGETAQTLWNQIPSHFKNVNLDSFVIMPNHIHAIVILQGDLDVGATHASPLRASGPPQGSLAAVIGSYKSAASKQINQQRDTPGIPVWQRNYYEHVIRNEKSLSEIRQYIANNPSRWSEDQENPNIPWDTP